MLVMCAVVTCVMPPATGPLSSTATCLPERASRYAVVRPAMPAPMMQASTWRFSCRGVNSGIAAVPDQTDWWRAIVDIVEQETVLLARLPKRHELFRRRGMDPDRLVELLLRGAKLHRNGEALDHLAGVGADHVRADHALARPVDDQLHEGALRLFSHGELEPAERCLVDVDLAMALARFFLRQAHGRDVGIGEHGSGHIVVVDRSSLAAE